MIVCKCFFLVFFIVFLYGILMRDQVVLLQESVEFIEQFKSNSRKTS